MGIYSLDHYEQYKTLVFRPEQAIVKPVNPGYGTTSLLPESSLPILTINNEDGITTARRAHLSFALLLEVSDATRLDVATRIAQLCLQRHWERQPVYAAINGKVTPLLLDDLLRWHVRGANTEALPGCDLQLRRLICAHTLSTMGAMPLRLWFVNAGHCPIYEPLFCFIHLRGANIRADLPLQTDPFLFRKLGDIVHNEVLNLPQLPSGEYCLSLSLRDSQGQVFKLNLADEHENGSYVLGTLMVDQQPRPELFNIWDNYYPEGYYPLEDPKEPMSGET